MLASFAALDAKLRDLVTQVAPAMALAAMAAGLNDIEDAIQSELDADGSLSTELRDSLKRTVGARMLRAANGRSSYVLAAKVGFGVGRHNRAEGKRSGKHKSGVGISGQNVHWFALGTRERTTGARSSSVRRGGVKVGTRERTTGNAVRPCGRILPIKILQRALQRVGDIEARMAAAAKAAL